LAAAGDRTGKEVGLLVAGTLGNRAAASVPAGAELAYDSGLMQAVEVVAVEVAVDAVDVGSPR